MEKKLVTAWEEGGFRYEIFSTPIETQIKDIVPEIPYDKQMISVFDYLGGRTPLKGTGQRIYDYAKSNNIPYSTDHIETRSYTGKIMLYERSFLDFWFSEEHQRVETDLVEQIEMSEEDDDLPF
jgi:hypothetical protein